MVSFVFVFRIFFYFFYYLRYFPASILQRKHCNNAEYVPLRVRGICSFGGNKYECNEYVIICMICTTLLLGGFPERTSIGEIFMQLVLYPLSQQAVDKTDGMIL